MDVTRGVERPAWTAVRSAGRIVGDHPALRSVLDQAARVAPTPFPVLVTGESGTGKELLARLLHEASAVAGGPFVAVNCGTLPRELADSELFGHERGAFTGAASRRPGWFEEASSGTLVLDEIGELPFELQPKLLRVLETGHVRRVGGAGEVAVSVRIVAMTHRDLRQDVERGRFRLDLFHRLAGLELKLPPLRERRSDIPLLIERFLEELASEIGRVEIEDEAIRLLAAHEWPGNIRELRNAVRRAAILSSGRICAMDLARSGGAPPAGALRAAGCEPASSPSVSVPRMAEADDRVAHTLTADDVIALPGRTFDEIERAVLGWALRRHGGSRRQAARALAMARSTFCDKVKRYGLAS